MVFIEKKVGYNGVDIALARGCGILVSLSGVRALDLSAIT